MLCGVSCDGIVYQVLHEVCRRILQLLSHDHAHGSCDANMSLNLDMDEQRRYEAIQVILCMHTYIHMHTHTYMHLHTYNYANTVEPPNNRHIWDPLFLGHFVLC